MLDARKIDVAIFAIFSLSNSLRKFLSDILLIKSSNIKKKQIIMMKNRVKYTCEFDKHM